MTMMSWVRPARVRAPRGTGAQLRKRGHEGLRLLRAEERGGACCPPTTRTEGVCPPGWVPRGAHRPHSGAWTPGFPARGSDTPGRQLTSVTAEVGTPGAWGGDRQGGADGQRAHGTHTEDMGEKHLLPSRTPAGVGAEPRCSPHTEQVQAWGTFRGAPGGMSWAGVCTVPWCGAALTLAGSGEDPEDLLCDRWRGPLRPSAGDRALSPRVSAFFGDGGSQGGDPAERPRLPLYPLCS